MAVIQSISYCLQSLTALLLHSFQLCLVLPFHLQNTGLAVSQHLGPCHGNLLLPVPLNLKHSDLACLAYLLLNVIGYPLTVLPSPLQFLEVVCFEFHVGLIWFELGVSSAQHSCIVCQVVGCIPVQGEGRGGDGRSAMYIQIQYVCTNLRSTPEPLHYVLHTDTQIIFAHKGTHTHTHTHTHSIQKVSWGTFACIHCTCLSCQQAKPV